MILSTQSGDFAIPHSVAEQLPDVPPIPDPSAADFQQRRKDFQHWLDASPDHVIGLARLRRWHLVQEDLAAAAKAAGLPFVVTDDGLE